MTEPKELDIGDEDGYVFVKIGNTTQTVDVVEVWDRYCDILEKHGKEPDFASKLPPFLETLGFPLCSQRVAIRFINRLSEVIAALKKADAGAVWPAAPASTVSGQGISLEESSSSSEKT